MVQKKDGDYWIRAIFDLKQGSINKFNVEAMFLQLIAARIIAAENWKGKLSWVVCREERAGDCLFPPFRWKDHSNWSGIRLMSENRTMINDVFANQ